MAGRERRLPPLSRMESQVLLLLWRLAPLTAREVHGHLCLHEPASCAGVRDALRRLEIKSYVAHAKQGRVQPGNGVRKNF